MKAYAGRMCLAIRKICVPFSLELDRCVKRQHAKLLEVTRCTVFKCMDSTVSPHGDAAFPRSGDSFFWLGDSRGVSGSRFAW